MNEYFDAKLAEIPRDFLKDCVAFLRSEIPDYIQANIRTLYESEGSEWAIPFHHEWGRNIRNALRLAGFFDSRLPDKNWDDYYIQVVELAVGIRK